MNKIFHLCIALLLLCFYTGTLYAQSHILNDKLYFPSGSYGNATDFMKVNIISDNSDFNLYTLIYGNKKFGNNLHIFDAEKKDIGTKNAHKKLFLSIFNREYNKHKISHNPDNSDEYLSYARELKKEVEVAQFRYEDQKQAVLDRGEIEKKLTPILDLYFNSLDTSRGVLEFFPENICGSSLYKKLDFSLKNNTFVDIKKYYIFGINDSNSGRLAWNNGKIILNEKDLLSLNKKMFFFKEVHIQPTDSSPLIHSGVKRVQVERLEKKHNYSFLDQKLGNLHFQIHYQDLVNYYKNNGDLHRGPGGEYAFDRDGKDDRVKMKFSLLGINQEGQVEVISNVSQNISVELNNNTVNIDDVSNACQFYLNTGKSSNTEAKISHFFEKLDKRYGFDNIRLKQKSITGYQDFHHENNHFIILIDPIEAHKMKIYQKFLTQLYIKISQKSLRLDAKLDASLSQKPLNKGKIEMIASNRNTLRKIERGIYLQKGEIDYAGFHYLGRLGEINRYLEKYNKASRVQSTSEKSDRELIVFYFGNISKKLFPQAHSLEYKPYYTANSLRAAYHDIVGVSNPKNSIIKIQDYYKVKVILTDSKGLKETYLIDMKIIQNRIHVLHSIKI